MEDEGLSQSGNNKNGLESSPQINETISLEMVEVELALGAQDIVTQGFEETLRKAADLVGGKLIFNVRAEEDSDHQRIAAIAISDGSAEQTVYVLLANDGLTMTVTSDKSSFHRGLPQL